MSAKITFGDVSLCHSCRGSGRVNGHTCARCLGLGMIGSTAQQPTTPSTIAVARRTDPDTSHAAARSIPADAMRESQRAVLDVLRAGPATDEQIADRLDGVQFPISPSGARTRRSELVYAGWVRDSGQRVRLASGRAAIVWEIVPDAE